MHLILAHSSDFGAAAVAEHLIQLAGPRSVRVIRPEMLGLARWAHRVDARGRASTLLRPPNGEPILSQEIDSLFNRVRHFAPPHFQRAAPKDRDYAFAELQSTVASWLAGLGERVVPSVRRHHLVTPTLTFACWATVAAEHNLPVTHRCAASSARFERAWPGSAGEGGETWAAAASPDGWHDPGGACPPVPAGGILVTGTEAAGPLAARFGSAAVAAAQVLGFPILEFRFAVMDRQPVLCDVDPFPSLAQSGAAGRVAQFLQTLSEKSPAMILLYGRLDDPPLARTLEALQEAGATYALLAQEALDHDGLFLESGPAGIGGEITVAGQIIPLPEISSVYARPLELPDRANTPAGAPMRRLHEQLMAWLDVAPALIVSRPRAMHSNASKPMQAQLIAESGFEVPETRVTSDADEAREFWRKHGRVIFKSISGVRSIVRELDEKAASRLGLLAALPVQFQAWVPGVDVRVHVVGGETFAAKIESSVTDYRYAEREHGETTLTPTEVPAEVARRCVALARRLELPLAGIDLRRRPDGGYTCFEVNPMPAYTYFEAHTGLPISQALAALLMAGETNPGKRATQHGSNHRESLATAR